MDATEGAAVWEIYTGLGSHLSDYENPHQVDKSDVGLSNVTNDKQATKSEFETHLLDSTSAHGIDSNLSEKGEI